MRTILEFFGLWNNFITVIPAFSGRFRLMIYWCFILFWFFFRLILKDFIPMAMAWTKTKIKVQYLRP